LALRHLWLVVVAVAPLAQGGCAPGSSHGAGLRFTDVSAQSGISLINVSGSPAKRQKVVEELSSRPKSKKELRQERKAALKAKAEADALDERSSNDNPKAQEERRRREERKTRKEEKERALEARYREQDDLS